MQTRSKILRAALTGVSALAFATIFAPSQAFAACAETDAGKNWDCNGTIAASQAETFTVDQWHGVLQGGSINPALITGNGTNAVGITVTGDVEGTFDVQDGAVITHPDGGGTRNGLVITSAGTTSANPIHVNIDGDVSTADAAGAAVVLTGAATTTFDLNVGATSAISGVVNGISVTQSGILTIDVAEGATVAGTAGNGISAASTAAAGTTTVTVDGSVTGAGTGADGVVITNTGGGALNVTVNGTGSVTGNSSGWGILAAASGGNGNNSITVDGAVTEGGINSSTVGTGTNTVVVGVDGSVTDTGGIGMTLTSVNGAAEADLGEDATVSGSGSGIAVAAGGSGSAIIDMDSGSSVTAGTGDGLTATSTTGGVTVTAENVTANAGNGIVTSGATASTIDVNGEVIGLGTGAGTAVIDITTGSNVATTLTINNGGDVHSTGGTGADLAIKGTTGSVIVHVLSGGELTGRVDFSGLTGTDNVAMTNAGNSWTVTGTNTFSANADSFVNTGSIHASGVTLLDFAAGADTFTNGSGGTTGTITMVGNSVATDTTELRSVAYTGTSGRSVLDVDAHLGGTGGTANTSDKLIIGAGSTTAGVTYVDVNNLNSISSSSLNSTGIVVVQGSTAAGQFVLDPSQSRYNSSKDALDEGFYDYSLTHTGGNDVLVSTPSDETLELATLATAAQDIWQNTSPWQDRQADLRDSAATQSHEVNPGVWGKGVGRWTSRNTSQTVTSGGVSTVNHADYDQNTYGFVGGIDGSKNLSIGTVLVGVQGGYLDSKVDFNSSANSAQFTGFLAGGYATLLRDGFFVDGAFKANLLQMKYSAPSLGGSATPDVQTYGGEVDVGKRFALAGFNMGSVGDAFVEPVAGASYARTSVDNFTIAGTTVNFADNETLRANVGARIGATVADTNAMKARVAVTGRLWDEFLGNNKVSFTSPGPTATSIRDDFSGIFGEGGLGLNVFGKGASAGLSGFVNGSVKFKQDYLSPGVTGGVRFVW